MSPTTENYVHKFQFCKVQVAKYRKICSYQKKAVPLQQKTKNKDFTYSKLKYITK